MMNVQLTANVLLNCHFALRFFPPWRKSVKKIVEVKRKEIFLFDDRREEFGRF